MALLHFCWPSLHLPCSWGTGWAWWHGGSSREAGAGKGGGGGLSWAASSWGSHKLWGSISHPGARPGSLQQDSVIWMLQHWAFAWLQGEHCSLDELLLFVSFPSSNCAQYTAFLQTMLSVVVRQLVSGPFYFCSYSMDPCQQTGTLA